MPRRFGLWPLLLLVTPLSCSDDPASPEPFDGSAIQSACALQVEEGGTPTRAPEDLDRARGRWASAPHEHYFYRYDFVCFCVPRPRPVFLEVLRGEVVAAYDEETGEAIGESAFSTIDDLFDLIQDAIDRDVEVLSVVYHETSGIPLSAYIDPRLGTADDERSFAACGLVTP